ncbi:hypothetical protein K435DRAFT_832898 [Dendrothele bispora CBS 962.96]|uniref:Diphthine--ammonia ligase n=1 Tax=Dendrothele bispora (strain CBS 962.96) TaxID=1314807 RepID=A0A4S8MYF0_DENBC|nr:hypothetical protein K435DRAFT_832898 [Dendrothele bispora CBS 962.96]
MKYVALLSGGKDSCFNLVHCHKNGHQLVAAASLRPGQGKEELDSYLYQTVGQDAIEFVARALEVPLYRRVISGTAVEQGSEYGPRNFKHGIQGDETEDLYELLSTVKSRHPEIQGVSVGAILSNYQRVRVEHVCARLSLTALCYLWQRPQNQLLDEMIDAGMNAILIKVAGIGLTTKHLGKTLEEMRPTLIKLNNLYGSHICGEGGEYETLTLDCPLFKSRIVLEDIETVIHSDNDFATVAFLRIKDASLEPKDGIANIEVQVPSLLDDDFQAVRDTVAQYESGHYQAPLTTDPVVGTQMDFESSSTRKGKWIAIGNVRASVTEDMPIEVEITRCFEILKDRLSSHGNLTLSNCANINIFLSSISLFARVNTVYSTFFGTSPPARACVAVDLPSPTRVCIDCIAFAEDNPQERQALHVQSQSYWAPANIGPYSQAIVVDERIFVSGQIGLIPSSITMPLPPSLSTEVALSMQHAQRVIEALHNGWDGHVQTAIYWLSDVDNLDIVRKGIEVYAKDRAAIKLLVAVKSLPKGALVEKQVLVHTGRILVPDEDEESSEDLVLKTVTPSLQRGDIAINGFTGYWETCKFTESPGSVVTLLCIRNKDFNDNDWQVFVASVRSTPALQTCWSRTLSIRVFLSTEKPPGLSHEIGGSRNFGDLLLAGLILLNSIRSH